MFGIHCGSLSVPIDLVLCFVVVVVIVIIVVIIIVISFNQEKGLKGKCEERYPPQAQWQGHLAKVGWLVTGCFPRVMAKSGNVVRGL